MNILESLQKLIDLGFLEVLMQLANNPLFLIMVVAIAPWFALRGVLLAWLQSQQKQGRK